jgi:hypothetical protein
MNRASVRDRPLSSSPPPAGLERGSGEADRPGGGEGRDDIVVEHDRIGLRRGTMVMAVVGEGGGFRGRATVSTEL